MSEEIAQWLVGLGLGQYSRAFADNGIGFDILPRLSDDNLKELGLNIGDRVRLQVAIEKLSGNEALARPGVQPETTTSSEAERRQLTVLFCDLVGSTTLSARLDPEDMRELLQDYQDACATAITRYGGYVAKFMGDGVFAYFGYPTAHENDAERAVHAGLDIVDAVGALERDLSVRIGVATGTVAVGDMIGQEASEEAAIVGEAPNLAARLQEIAAPDTVVIGEATHNLAGGLFDTSSFGLKDLKGFSEPVAVWRVDRLRRAESRFQATRGEHLTELIGRDEELEIMMRRWARAKVGDGQVVLLSGEPGIGKSRVVHAFRSRIAADAPYVRVLQCSPQTASSALFPFFDAEAHAIGFTAESTNEEKLAKLEDWIRDADQPLEETVPIFSSAFGIEDGSRYQPLEISPQRHRQLLLEAILNRTVRIAASQPHLLIVEDAHWMDPSSLEFLNAYIEKAPEIAVLIIVTYRPEFEAPWVGQPRTTLLTLNRLDREECSKLTTRVSGAASLEPSVIERIAERTDGVPLFVEELTKAVVDASADDPTAMTDNVPATLQDALEARLDALGPAREIAQISAVIGRSFPHDLLVRVASTDDGDLKNNLDHLETAGLIFRRGEAPDAIYTFKHALIQDTAYGSLLRGRRSELHELVARTLEHDFLETSQSAPEILAHHFTEAGLADRAVDYWKRAGELAARRFANAEAIEHLTRAINLLHTLPDDEQLPERELEILTALFGPTGTLKGYIHADTEQNYVRALELCERIGDTPLIFPALFGSFSLNMGLGQTAKCLEIGQTFLSRAQSYGDDINQMVGHRLVGTALLNSGDPSQALDHLNRVIDMYIHNRHENLGIEYQIDPKLAGLSQSALALWILGYPERALKRRDEAVILGERLGQPVSKVYASVFCGCMLSALLRDRDEVGSYAKSVLSITEDFGVVSWATFGRYFSVWMDAETLIAANALSTLDEEMVGCRKLNPGYQALLLGLHAEVLDKAGEHEKALAILDSAEIYQDQGGDRLYAAELCRIRGQVALNEAGDALGAEQSFKKAIAIAQSQSAKSWELRATTSLARLWKDHGKALEAHDLLATVYDWFTEGFDTSDLKEAKTLLEGLS